MNPQSALDTYRRDSIENAPPLKLVRMLYQGAIRFLDRAMACEAKDPRSQFVHWLDRADAIVTELRVSLEKSHAPEVSDNLEQLYLFCESEMQRAMNDRDPSTLPAVRKVLSQLLEAWTSIEVRQSKGE
ncbi:MAG: flagellar export chaperone FliS [Planctomycetes bacterium]|nr:flagellar export chaperone FliS [Planctomycetota bacterium]